MGKLVVGLVGFLSLCAVVLLLPPPAASQSTQATPGWYTNSGRAPIHDGNEWRIMWENSYIYQRPGTDNLYWYAQITYFNKTNKTLTLDCFGEDQLPPVREHITRGGTYLGYVDAEQTFCDGNQSWIGYIQPGETFNDWVIFHNVPWLGDQVRLQWDPYGFSEWVNPWQSPPFFGPPPAECPHELVTLGTCQPAKLPSIALTPEQLQMIENVPFCAADIAGIFIPGLGFVKDLKKLNKAVKIGTIIIAIYQDPNNLNNYYQFTLEAAGALPIPFGSCLTLVSAVFIGQFIGPIHPVINPPGIAPPTPTPTPTPSTSTLNTISDIPGIGR